MKKICVNCQYSGDQFKIAGKTHLHCQSPNMEKEAEKDDFSPWESLREFYNTCDDFKQKEKHETSRQSR